MNRLILSALFIVCLDASAFSQQEQSNSEIAKQLNNPLSSLITIPFDLEYNTGFGPADGYNTTLYLEPVFPFQINKDYSLVTRTILPISWQNDIAGPSGRQFGLGDTQQGFYLTPPARETAVGTLSIGAGPAVTWPTSTDRLLGLGTLGLGLSAVAIVQNAGWTVGGLITQQWGVAETRDNVPDLNTTFLEPFVAYTNSEQWTFALYTESCFDWTAQEWSVPVTGSVSKLVNFGRLPVELEVGATFWAESPTGGPSGLGVRTQATIVLPTNLRTYAD